MPEITKRATFYADGTAPRTFHIETDGAIVNITVGLRDRYGRKVTRVAVSPDDASRGGDADGYLWHQTPGDARIIRDEKCRHCAKAIIPTGDGTSWLHRSIPVKWCDLRTRTTQAQPEDTP